MTLKKTLPGVLILALAAIPVMIGGYVVADDSNPNQTPRRHHGRMMAANGGGDHGGIGALRGMMRLFRDLDLSDSQMDQIDVIFEAAKPEMQTLRQQLADGRQAWHESSSPTEFDETAAREFATSQAALHAEIMVLGMKTKAQVLGVLTPEQLETLQEARSRGRRGGGFGGQFTSP